MHVCCFQNLQHRHSGLDFDAFYRERAIPKHVPQHNETITESKTESQSLHQQKNYELEEISATNISTGLKVVCGLTATQIIGGEKQEIPKAAQLPPIYVDSAKNEQCDEGKHLIYDGYENILNGVQWFGAIIVCSILAVLYLFNLKGDGEKLQKVSIFLSFAIIVLLCFRLILKGFLSPTGQRILNFSRSKNKNCKWDHSETMCSFVFVTYSTPDQEMVFHDILHQFDGSWVNFIVNLNCMSKNPIDETMAIPFTPRQKSLAPFSLFTPAITGTGTPTFDKRDPHCSLMMLKPIYPTCLTINCLPPSSKNSIVSVSVRRPSLIRKERCVSVEGHRLSGDPPKTYSGSFGEQSHSIEGGQKDVPSDGGRNHQTGQKPSRDRFHDSFHPSRKDGGEEKDLDQSESGYSHPQTPPSKEATHDTQIVTGMHTRSQTPETSELNGGSVFLDSIANPFSGKQYDPGGILSLAKEGIAASLSSKDGADSGYSSRPPSKLLKSLIAKTATCLPETDLLCIPCEATQNEDSPMAASGESTLLDSTSHVLGQAIQLEEDSFFSSFNTFVECAFPTFQLDSDDAFPVPQIAESPRSLLPPALQPFLYPYH